MQKTDLRHCIYIFVTYIRAVLYEPSYRDGPVTRTDFVMCSYEKFHLVTEMKERPEGHKIPKGSLCSLKTLGTTVSAKFKSANKHGATKSGVVRIPRVVSYRCFVAIAA